jgi:branched-chain amino acid transport system ATP-binding protein
MALLEVKGLTKHFGGLIAVNNVDIVVEKGMILGIIGPNGAGKTTLYNLITGVFPLTSGKVIFKGEDVTHLSTNRRAGKGLVRTFQTTSLFHDMTAFQNIQVAHHLFRKSGQFAQFITVPGSRREEKRVRERSLEILEFLGLGEVKDELARNLPHGHQRALGIAIAMAADPELLLLDEPVTGMNEVETTTMMGMIRGIRDKQGVTIVLVEHDMRAMMGLSEHIIALNFGKKIAEGTPHEVVNNRDVIEAYLGLEEGN